MSNSFGDALSAALAAKEAAERERDEARRSGQAKHRRAQRAEIQIARQAKDIRIYRTLLGNKHKGIDYWRSRMKDARHEARIAKAQRGRFERERDAALSALALAREALRRIGTATVASINARSRWSAVLTLGTIARVALDDLDEARAALAGAPGMPTFQARVDPWLHACFGPEIARDKIERNHRFLEEALELVQSGGCTEHEAHQLVTYVYGRPVGEMAQEVGGVMNTLAALCLAHGLDMHDAGEVELARVWTKVEQIRAKQAAKPKHSPLPGPTPGVIPVLDAGGGMHVQMDLGPRAPRQNLPVEYMVFDDRHPQGRKMTPDEIAARVEEARSAIAEQPEGVQTALSRYFKEAPNGK